MPLPSTGICPVQEPRLVRRHNLKVSASALNRYCDVQEPWLVHSEVDFLEAQVQQVEGRKQELLQRRVPDLCAELAGLQVGRLIEKLVPKRGALGSVTWHAFVSARQSQTVGHRAE